MTLTDLVDPFDPALAVGAEGLLRKFNQAGVLVGADIHVASRLTGGDEDTVMLAAALAVRAPRLGHVCVDLATVRDSVIVDDELAGDARDLPWPEASEWCQRVANSEAVAAGPTDGGDAGGDGTAGERRPLCLDGTLLYLDRYWRDERAVASDLTARGAPVTGVDGVELSAGLDRLFGRPLADQPDLQRLAAATAVLRHLAVVAGGPGTGKTTTVARILALLHDQARVAGAPDPLFALAAPTGKAAARLEEAVHGEAHSLDISDETRKHLLATRGMTMHRLLGWQPGTHNRFRHNRRNRLPHDVVVVDETSMVPLSLMARLVEAVRNSARLVLVGDPEQLASVEAGAVLGDIVGPAVSGLVMQPAARERLAEITTETVQAVDPPPGPTIGDGIVVLQEVHRFGGAIAKLAGAVRAGDAGAAVEHLANAAEGIHWIQADIASPGASLAQVREPVVAAARAVVDAAQRGEGGFALQALASFRVLCAHRLGPYGVATWRASIEGWLASEIEGFGSGGAWYPGRPLLVTENDYSLRLFNGDTGVVVTAGSGRVAAAFERQGQVIEVSPNRLAAVETVYAMTVHKSQGSQFGTVAVLLPEPGSAILTRELLYTAITRARENLIVAGTEAAVRAAIGRPIARSSGLRRSLWGA